MIFSIWWWAGRLFLGILQIKTSFETKRDYTSFCGDDDTIKKSMQDPKSLQISTKSDLFFSRNARESHRVTENWLRDRLKYHHITIIHLGIIEFLGSVRIIKNLAIKCVRNRKIVDWSHFPLNFFRCFQCTDVCFGKQCKKIPQNKAKSRSCFQYSS